MSRDNTNQKNIDKKKLYQFLLRFFFCLSLITVAFIGVFVGSFQILIWGYGFIFLIYGLLGIIFKIPIAIRMFKNPKGNSFKFVDYFICYFMIFVGTSLLLLMIIYN